MKLVDFRVRITSGGTEAVTRVLIESADGAGAALVDGRGLGQHRRRELPGAAGRDPLEAAARRRAGGGRRLMDPLFWELHAASRTRRRAAAADTLRALALTGLSGPVRVLDVGCGPGAASLTLLAALPEAR